MRMLNQKRAVLISRESSSIGSKIKVLTGRDWSVQSPVQTWARAAWVTRSPAETWTLYEPRSGQPQAHFSPISFSLLFFFGLFLVEKGDIRTGICYIPSFKTKLSL